VFKQNSAGSRSYYRQNLGQSQELLSAVAGISKIWSRRLIEAFASQMSHLFQKPTPLRGLPGLARAANRRRRPTKPH